MSGRNWVLIRPGRTRRPPTESRFWLVLNSVRDDPIFTQTAKGFDSLAGALP